MTMIMGIKLDNRSESAIEFQKVLTNFGCIIKTRLGLHDASADVCSPNGLIILEVLNKPEAEEFKDELLKIQGIEVKTMKFD